MDDMAWSDMEHAAFRPTGMATATTLIIRIATISSLLLLLPPSTLPLFVGRACLRPEGHECVASYYFLYGIDGTVPPAA